MTECGKIGSLGVLLLLVAGCGGPNIGKPTTVAGKVAMAGQPMADVQVTFHALEKLPAEYRTRSAKTDASGTYSMPDVYPGEYRVMVEKFAAMPKDPGAAPANPVSGDNPLVKYGAESELRAKVDGTKTEFNFDL